MLNVVQQLILDKLSEVESYLESLTTLRNELQLLINLCKESEDGCPIIEGLDE